ncbi:hypothetical protein ACVWXO_003171 [Bradyrhizobium sp. LM2.7]
MMDWSAFSGFGGVESSLVRCHHPRKRVIQYAAAVMMNRDSSRVARMERSAIRESLSGGAIRISLALHPGYGLNATARPKTPSGHP